MVYIPKEAKDDLLKSDESIEKLEDTAALNRQHV